MTSWEGKNISNLYCLLLVFTMSGTYYYVIILVLRLALDQRLMLVCLLAWDKASLRLSG